MSENQQTTEEPPQTWHELSPNWAEDIAWYWEGATPRRIQRPPQDIPCPEDWEAEIEAFEEEEWRKKEQEQVKGHEVKQKKVETNEVSIKQNWAKYLQQKWKK